MNATIEYDIVGPSPPQIVDVLLFQAGIMSSGQYVNLDFDQIKTSIKDYLKSNINFTITTSGQTFQS